MPLETLQQPPMASPPNLPYNALWKLEPASVGVKLSRGLWRRAPHLDYLSAKLAEMWRRPLQIIVKMPPRHSKSETCSHWTPVWLLENWPDKRVMLASYEATFAATWGRAVRNSITENADTLTVRIKPDVSASNAWETTAGGGMVTAGVGGPITGRGA